MGRSLRIGSLSNIGLYIHWSFLLIPLLVLMSSWGSGMFAVMLGIGIVLALFFCVLLHELGHALMARVFGIGTRDITLFPIGGVARLERMSDNPQEEIAIAIAGPAVNVVIAVSLGVGMLIAGVTPWSLSVDDPLDLNAVLRLLFQANVGLVLFNLIPAFPMDGGRVFRAAVAMALGRLRATEIAVYVSRILAFGFIVGGLLGWLPLLGEVTPMISIIGIFLLFAGQQELGLVRRQEEARHYEAEMPAELLQPLHNTRSPLLIESEFSGFTWDPRLGAWIQWHLGKPVGACYVDRKDQQW